MLTFAERQYQGVCGVLMALKSFGLRDVCLAPGGRNAPLVAALNALDVNVIPFFEERSAAFFALGRIIATGRLVALVTTSGTACAECLPAVMEAFFSHLMLVVISADRPSSYYGSGAPQAVWQKNIFGAYAFPTLEFEDPFWGKGIAEMVAIMHACIHQQEVIRPVHLNIALDEPLWLGTMKPLTCESFVKVTTHPMSSYIKPLKYMNVGAELPQWQKPPFSAEEALGYFFSQVSFPIVMIGSMPSNDVLQALEILKSCPYPVYLESLSGIPQKSIQQGIVHLSSFFSPRRLAHHGYAVDGVLRIGGVPTHRFWRDCEKNSLPVLSISHLAYTALSKPSVWVPWQEGLVALKKLWQYAHFTLSSKFLEDQKNAFMHIQAGLETYPLSELSWIEKVKARIDSNAMVYLGNSLSIRYWNILHNKHTRVYASRGVNGIDGQLSTFFGLSWDECNAYAIVGDLTALYDLASGWVVQHPLLKGRKLRICVMNNQGGMIFKNMYPSEVFLNRHNCSLQHFANLWGWKYYSISTLDAWHTACLDMESHDRVLLEFYPDEQASLALLQHIGLLARPL